MSIRSVTSHTKLTDIPILNRYAGMTVLDMITP